VPRQALQADIGRNKAEIIREACGGAAPGGAAEMAWGISAPTVVVQYEQPGSLGLTEAKGCIVATSPLAIALYTESSVLTIPTARIAVIKAQAK
jgi:hypothetical protein